MKNFNLKIRLMKAFQHLIKQIAATLFILCIANGHTLKSFALSNKGAGQINISADTLSSGSYFYSLLVDGKKTDTKQMILTK
jgi:hypothetical protein